MDADLTHADIRRLLKTFGVQADEAILAHLKRVPGNKPLRIRLILEDITPYDEPAPTPPLHLVVEGLIRR